MSQFPAESKSRLGMRAEKGALVHGAVCDCCLSLTLIRYRYRAKVAPKTAASSVNMEWPIWRNASELQSGKVANWSLELITRSG